MKKQGTAMESGNDTRGRRTKATKSGKRPLSTGKDESGKQESQLSRLSDSDDSSSTESDTQFVPRAKRVRVKQEPGVNARKTVTIKQEPKDGEISRWTEEDLNRLIDRIEKLLPKDDHVKFSTQAERLPWEQVCFDSYTAEQCKTKWTVIVTKLRRFRTLTELVGDAKQWVKQPWTSFSAGKKNNKHPDMPKKPLTPYFRYFIEKREKYSQKYPNLSMTDLSQILAKKFQELAEKKKQKYHESFLRENEQYKAALEKFKEDHPGVLVDRKTSEKAEKASVSAPTVTPGLKGPRKPQTPLQLFMAEKLEGEENTAVKKEKQEKVRKLWNNLTDPKRLKWIQKALEDQQRYEAELEEFRQEHPDFRPDNTKSVLTKAEQEIKDRYDGKPEKPPNSGYSLYSKIMMRQLTNFPNKEKMAEISRRWKELTDTERDNYNKEAEQLNKKYKQDYERYLNRLTPEERKQLEGKGKRSPKKPANQKADSDTQPERPKKPFSAMFYYQSEKYPLIKAKYPQMSNQEVTRLIAREFSELPAKKKEKYKKMADGAKKSFERNHTSTKETPNSNKSNKLIKGEPKKPPSSGYQLYTSETIAKLTHIETRKRMAEISKQWKELPDEEKEAYKKRAQAMMAQYQKDLQKFLTSLPPDERQKYDAMTPRAKKAARAAAARVIKANKQRSESESAESDAEDGNASQSFAKKRRKMATSQSIGGFKSPSSGESGSESGSETGSGSESADESAQSGSEDESARSEVSSKAKEDQSSSDADTVSQSGSEAAASEVEDDPVSSSPQSVSVSESGSESEED